MIRLGFAIGIAAALMICASPSSSRAAENKSKSTSQELDSLRQTIEEQSKQIEVLTQQVAHLTELLEAHSISTTATPAPAAQHASPATENSPVATSGTSQPAAETPGVHIVAKGETLTSIAKHYKLTVGELLKVNKIENDRMLQIGQTLVIPVFTPSPTPP